MKRIITCSDGTWNKPDNKDHGVPVQTNVEKLFSCICTEDENGINQEKAYDEGVGTGYSMIDRFYGGITGAGIDKNIKDMYSFIVLNYEEGDDIFLFGFSRGAYTARSLAGFIRNCGILTPNNIQLVDRAYELYRNRNKYTASDSDMMISFRKNFCHKSTAIKFIGVWDTVGALGIPLPWFGKRYRFHDHRLGSTVEHAYHALAIDDRRVLFRPTLWELDEEVADNENHKQVMEQRWFAGVHSNVGGGYADCGLSDLALKWLIKKAQEVGLCFHRDKINQLKPDPTCTIRNPHKPMYWLPPLKYRTISLNDATHQTIDESVWERCRCNEKYRPKNLVPYWSVKEKELKEPLLHQPILY